MRLIDLCCLVGRTVKQTCMNIICNARERVCRCETESYVCVGAQHLHIGPQELQFEPGLLVQPIITMVCSVGFRHAHGCCGLLILAAALGVCSLTLGSLPGAPDFVLAAAPTANEQEKAHRLKELGHGSPQFVALAFMAISVLARKQKPPPPMPASMLVEKRSDVNHTTVLAVRQNIWPGQRHGNPAEGRNCLAPDLKRRSCWWPGSR